MTMAARTTTRTSECSLLRLPPPPHTHTFPFQPGPLGPRSAVADVCLPFSLRSCSNFFVYGGNGMKNDFGGHDNYHHDNVYAWVGQAIGFYDAPMLAGHEDKFNNNKVAMTGTDFGSPTCSGTGQTEIHDNQYFTTTGKMTECSKDLADWQKAGHDTGSTVAFLPHEDVIIGWGKAKLGM